MKNPIIGLTARNILHNTKDDVSQTITIGINIDYTDSVMRSGGAPILLPRTNDKNIISAVMDKIDGLLLTGGGDVVSLNYGEQPHPKAVYQDPIRDEMELEAIKIAVKKGVPILGICRGIQILNVAFGGTLEQDIPSSVADAVLHYTRPRDKYLAHTIEIEKNSLLAKVLGTTKTNVNSWHHQAVKDVGKGLKINSRALDGVIEGIEADDGKPILAVQCHPEDCNQEYPIFKKLFDWLVKEAK